MMFQKRIDRAFRKLKEDRETYERENHPSKEEDSDLDQEIKKKKEDMNLEKGDLFAMILSAFLIIIPIALVVIVFLMALGYFFLIR